MRIFDLHCDTLYSMYEREEGFYSNRLNISLEKTRDFDEYAQVLAIWSKNDLPEHECLERFFQIYKYYKEHLPADFRHVLAVEGGRMLDGDINNLDVLYDLGIRIMTLVWGGECSLGGAHDTDAGLTDFGKTVVKRCFDLGIVPDVSHASDKMFWQVYETACKEEKPFAATHSNSRRIYNHSRNLSDDMFCALRDCKGVVGISLEPTHLSQEYEPNIDTVCRHIIHYLELDGEDTVCLGCDFDGVTRNIACIPDISYMFRLEKALLSKGIPEDTVDKIFYRNANNFIIRNVKL